MEPKNAKHGYLYLEISITVAQQWLVCCPVRSLDPRAVVGEWHAVRRVVEQLISTSPELPHDPYSDFPSPGWRLIVRIRINLAHLCRFNGLKETEADYDMKSNFFLA